AAHQTLHSFPTRRSSDLGSSLASSALITPVSDNNWTIRGVGDFDGDGRADILWRNTVSGENAIWFINGTTVASTALFQTVDPTWLIAGVGDYDGDGRADILWRQPSTGQNAIWLMTGASMASSALIQAVPDTHWTIVK